MAGQKATCEHEEPAAYFGRVRAAELLRNMKKNIQLVAENTALKFVRRKGEGARESKRILPSMSRGLA
jgi:hypothetical protein